MAILKKVNPTDARELKDHRDNTSHTHVKCYTLAQLSVMDGIDTRTIKNSGKYLPVRIDTAKSIYNYKRGTQKSPYTTMYIRLDEIKFIFNKRTGKKLTIDF